METKLKKKKPNSSSHLFNLTVHNEFLDNDVNNNIINNNLSCYIVLSLKKYIPLKEIVKNKKQ